MLRPFRSPGLAWLALVGLLVAQPAVGCALLCLDNHHGHREMAGSAGASGPISCHTQIGPAMHHRAALTVSVMAPAVEAAPLRAVAASVRVPAARPATPAYTAPSPDPPPPRLV